MDEEKTIDEAVEEKADEVKEFEPVAFDEVIKDEPAKESAPALRDGGDPEPADMNMIHKHLDNFLAMLCGETPIDENVRDSTEYWLKRLADGNGGSTKKIYIHPLAFLLADGGRLGVFIFNNDPTPFITSTFLNWLAELYASVGNSARVLATGTGFYENGSIVRPLSYIVPITNASFNVISDGSYYRTYTYAQFIDAVTDMSDGVNAIN